MPFLAAGSGALIDLFALEVIDLVAAVRNRQRSLLTIKRDERHAFAFARIATAVVPTNAFSAEMKDRRPGIRCFLIIVEMVTPAIKGDALRIVYSETPARHIERVNPVVR